MTEKSQPLFYKNPTPLQKELHSDAGLDKNISYKFAKNTNSVPLSMQEFAFTCKFYPIVFTTEDPVMPVAVLGLKNSVNFFVNHKGEWEKNYYIPAYVRRYPFAFTGAEDKLILCVDESSERFKKQSSNQHVRFFNKGEATDLTKHALQFCAEFHRDQKETAKFGQALKEKGLLLERQINVTAKEPISLKGFSVIDEERFNQLDAKTLAEWHANGYLGLIYAQLLSYTNWPVLASRV